jgi:phosphopantothenate synthetase
MLDAKQSEVAVTVFDRNKRREAEINDALRQEQARHEAAVKNMHRLRTLRLARDAKLKSDNPKRQTG